MKHLVIASDSYLPRWDGISRFLSEVVPPLAEKFKITLIVPDFGKEPPHIEGTKVVKIPTYGFQVADFIPSRFQKKSIRRVIQSADVVWTQTIGPIGMTTINQARKLKKPLTAYIHSFEWDLVSKGLSPYNPLKRFSYHFIKNLARDLYRRCNVLMVPSYNVAEIFRWAKIDTKKEVIHLGTDTSKFTPPTVKSKAKEQVGFSQNNIIIGFSGRIAREKDLITLYRAFIRLEKKFPNVKLLIIGEGVKDVKSTLKARDSIILTGAVDNVVPWLQAMDIFVLPSLTETSSLATMEAMACGCAVAATPVGYVRSYIKDGYNGLLFPFHEPYILYKHLENLVSKPELRIKLGRNARATIVNGFRWETTVEKISKVLENL